MSRSWSARPFLAAALLQALFLAGCATASPQPGPLAGYPPPGPPPEAYAAPLPPPPPPIRQEVLAELPQDAPAGECYAKVVIPGQPMIGPPQMQGATWVLNPGPPGSPGPIWCLVPTGPAPIVMSPEREGWIRVLCDVDATPARIERWQHKLQKEGFYQGGFTGRYDGPTADAVGRFQRHRRIQHGGYLSEETVGALEAPDAPALYAAPAPPPKAHGRKGKAKVREQTAASAYAGVAYQPYPAVAQQPVYGAPAYPGYPTYPQAYPAYPQTYAYPPAGYVQGSAQYGSSYGGSYSSQSSYSVSGSGYAYGTGMTPQSYSYGYASPVYSQGYSYGGGSGYGYGYGQGYGYAYPQAYPPPGYGYDPYGPRPAYAAGRSAIQNGWLTWDGKSRF